MTRFWLLFGAVWTHLPQVAWSCGGEGEPACAASEVEADPSSTARKAEWVGEATCSWTTSVMAQRVLADGSPWTYVGRLVPSGNALPSKVAAPFTAGPEGRVHVVANEVLERLDQRGVLGDRLSLEGKLLEVDGTTYLVLTGFGRAGS